MNRERGIEQVKAQKNDDVLNSFTTCSTIKDVWQGVWKDLLLLKSDLSPCLHPFIILCYERVTLRTSFKQVFTTRAKLSYCSSLSLDIYTFLYMSVPGKVNIKNVVQ
ncbi:hypothetical protein KIL84_014728 [Mauremys mutica]|uniref:Uncharacterized protein n=1 Tax=Mauremys mutica TaxID=74926 RepID=A0A9D3XQR8_9SAUR|nr:hypothetical protein KIL84_014728 [Mauremys mutica]